MHMARGPLGVTRAGRSPTVAPPVPGTLDYLLRSLRGGKAVIMETLAPAAVQYEPRLQAVLDRWQQRTPWQRRMTSLDDLLAEADLSPGAFLGAVVRAGYEMQALITPLVLALALPGVITASAKRAQVLGPAGFPDRKLLLEWWFSGGMQELADAAAKQPAPASASPGVRASAGVPAPGSRAPAPEGCVPEPSPRGLSPEPGGPAPQPGGRLSFLSHPPSAPSSGASEP